MSHSLLCNPRSFSQEKIPETFSSGLFSFAERAGRLLSQKSPRTQESSARTQPNGVGPGWRCSRATVLSFKTLSRVELLVTFLQPRCMFSSLTCFSRQILVWWVSFIGTKWTEPTTLTPWTWTPCPHPQAGPLGGGPTTNQSLQLSIFVSHSHTNIHFNCKCYPCIKCTRMLIQ